MAKKGRTKKFPAIKEKIKGVYKLGKKEQGLVCLFCCQSVMKNTKVFRQCS